MAPKKVTVRVAMAPAKKPVKKPFQEEAVDTDYPEEWGAVEEETADGVGQEVGEEEAYEEWGTAEDTTADVAEEEAGGDEWGVTEETETAFEEEEAPVEDQEEVEAEAEGEWGEEAEEAYQEGAEEEVQYNEGEEEEAQWQEGGEEEAGDDDEAEAEAAIGDADLAYEEYNRENSQDGKDEEQLLKRLRDGLSKFWPRDQFEIEPFGSFVTDLGLPNNEKGARSDLDVVLLFRGSQADSFENRSIRDRIVSPTIDRLGTWCRNQPGFTVTNVIRKARVPIVMFDTKTVSVDISVQQPWGVLNSWHLRDLSNSGWPGRLRALVRFVKMWAKSKSIHTAKDGSLSSYGFCMLVVGFLMEIGAVPALLPKGQKANGPYCTSDEALQSVLDACDASGGGAPLCERWKEPHATSALTEQAALAPAELFSAWLDWMNDTVLHFVSECKDVPGGPSAAPLARRRIVSLRPRSQQELRSDVQWSTKLREHWTPEREGVFLTIEEPLNGENVARCVRADGFHAIQAEIQRARDYFGRVAGTGQLPPFKALLRLPPLNTRSQPPSRPLSAPGGKGAGAWKRPWQQAAGAAGEPAFKRPRLGGAAAPPSARNFGAAAARSFVPTQTRAPPPGFRPAFGPRPGMQGLRPGMPGIAGKGFGTGFAQHSSGLRAPGFVGKGFGAGGFAGKGAPVGKGSAKGGGVQRGGAPWQSGFRR